MFLFKPVVCVIEPHGVAYFPPPHMLVNGWYVHMCSSMFLVRRADAEVFTKQRER